MKESDNPDNGNDQPPTENLTLLQLLGSALAAAFGVQSSKNRERDFSRGKPMQFIIIGVVLTALFVLVVVATVNPVLSSIG